MNIKSALSLVAVGLMGCSAATQSNDGVGADSTTPPAQTAKAAAAEPVLDANGNGASVAPVATLTVASGNRIEFYDAAEAGILISELGKAPTPPALTGTDRSLSAVEVWNKFSPTVAAPQALVDLQARADAYAQAHPSSNTSTPSSHGGSDAPQPIATPPGVSAVREALPVGCNNGCCDYAWLTQTLCADYTAGNAIWFYYNSYWSWEQNNNIDLLFETVCAASGTSRFGVHAGNSVSTFYIAESYYRNYSYHDGSFDSDNHSVVNANSNNQPVSPTNMHTFCGDAYQ